MIDFSNPLLTDAQRAALGLASYSQTIELIRSANSASAQPDGNFGIDPSFGTYGGANAGIGYTVVPNTTVTLTSSDPSNPLLANNRLEVTIQPGTSLPSDYYRLYIPNPIKTFSAATNSFSFDPRAIVDIYNNQLDGEFLGNPTVSDNTSVNGIGNNAMLSDPMANGTTYEDLLPNGQMRQGLSGDGVAGAPSRRALPSCPTAT